MLQWKQIDRMYEMKAIITVVGKDQKGIVAGVATKVAELDSISMISLETVWMNTYHDGGRIVR